MNDATTWKGHSVTLFIFAGLVLLCSIFFILGMLVGRTQAQKTASAEALEAALKAEAKPAPVEAKPDLTFFDSVERNAKPALDPPVREEAPPAPPRPEPAASPAPPVQPARDVVNYQIGAYRTQRDAERSLGNVRKRGFKALILSPAKGEANPWYRVYVGPFAPAEADSAKRKLEAAGLKPILRR